MEPYFQHSETEPQASNIPGYLAFCFLGSVLVLGQMLHLYLAGSTISSFKGVAESPGVPSLMGVRRMVNWVSETMKPIVKYVYF